MFPHEFLAAYLLDSIGRRSEVLEPLRDNLLIPITLGLTDQLSAYLDVRTDAKLRLINVNFRETSDRTYCLVQMKNGNAPLRMQGAMQGWRPRIPSSRPEDFVTMHVGRRWNFVDKNRGFLAGMFRMLADAIVAYYQRKPYARFTGDSGVPRILEGVDSTFLAVELDEVERTAELQTKDTPSRYRIPA